MYTLQRDSGSPALSSESRKRKQKCPESQHGGESHRLRKSMAGAAGSWHSGLVGLTAIASFLLWGNCLSPTLCPRGLGGADRPTGPIPLCSDWLTGGGHMIQRSPMRGLGLTAGEEMLFPTGHEPCKVSILLAVQVHRPPLSSRS